LHAQAGTQWTAAQLQDVAKAIQRCAHWHATPEVTIGATRPAKLAAALKRALRCVDLESSEE
jgi:uncharacterized protein YcaQ